MQVPLKKLLALAEPDSPPEVRAAAVVVLGELGVRDGAVGETMLAALDDPEAAVRLEAIAAVGKLRVDKALPQLAERLKHGGPEGERAAEAAARLGAKGSRMLHELMPRVAPGLRRYIAAALVGASAQAGDLGELDLLHDKDAGVIEATIHKLTEVIPQLDARRKKSIAQRLIELADDKKAPLGPAAEAGVVRLVGLLDDPAGAELLWDHLLPTRPAEVRARALSALGKWAASPNKEQRQRLFRCAAESDFRVAGPALMLLDKLPVTDKAVGEWLPLLKSPSLATRRLALTKVGATDSAEVAAALSAQLSHHDAAYREEVLAHLVRSDPGRKALAVRLTEAETAEAAWPLARAVARLAHAQPEAWADALFPLAAKYLEAADRRADPLLYVLREGSAVGLRDRLEKRASALVGKKSFEAAHRVYRALARDPAAGFPYRLALATCGLKVSPRELAVEARAQDHCLEQFADLARQDREAVLTRLEKTAWLEAEDLYYLGFHFAEQLDDELHSFGGAVLKLLGKRFPRNKLAAAAAKKLGSTGLAGGKKKKR